MVITDVENDSKYFHILHHKKVIFDILKYTEKETFKCQSSIQVSSAETLQLGT